MVGVGFYQFTAYLKKADEVESNVTVTYNDDHCISIQATKPIKKGDKLYLFKPIVVDEVN